ncbi:PTS fructose transporter subunit IIA, partial [Streptomyces sp. NPDC005195]
MSDSDDNAGRLVGIVLVSHSAAVAASVAELATGL